MTVDTPMRIASIGKLFTIVSILQLVESHKLNLDDVIGRYIPNYPNNQAATKIKIRHLLTHMGGTGDIFGAEGFSHRDELRNLEDYIRVFGNRPLRFEPGSKEEYSNYGFILLGVVIEKISGVSYYNYLQQRVFEPAGMEHTTFPIESPVPSPMSFGYTHMSFGPTGPRNDLPLTKIPEEPYCGTSAGGGFSTVTDLHRFVRALLEGKLISHEMTRNVFAAVRGIANCNFSYGFEKGTDKNGHIWIGHMGGAPGTDGVVRIYPDQNLIIITLSNIDPDGASAAADELASSF